MVIADIIVLTFTWARTFKHLWMARRVGARASVSATLLRDGESSNSGNCLSRADGLTQAACTSCKLSLHIRIFTAITYTTHQGTGRVECISTSFRRSGEEPMTLALALQTGHIDHMLHRIRRQRASQMLPLLSRQCTYEF